MRARPLLVLALPAVLLVAYAVRRPPALPDAGPPLAPTTVPVLDAAPERLPQGANLSRAIALGGRHRYQLALTPGAFVAVDVTQRGADVVVSLHTADGAPVQAADSPFGGHGPERLAAVVERGGDYQLTVSAPNGRAGDYQLVVQVAPDPSTHQQRLADAAATFYRGEQARRARHNDQGAAAYREACSRFTAAGDPYGTGLASYRLGKALQTVGDHDAALDAFAAAVRRLDLADEARPTAAAHYARSRLLRRLGRTEAAIGDLQHALAIYQSIGDRRFQASRHNDLASAYQDLGDSRRALAHYDAAEAIYRALGASKQLAAVLSNRGTLYLERGELEVARELLLEALALRRELSVAAEAVTLTHLGTVFRRLSEAERARRHLEAALALRREYGDRAGEAVTLVGLGLALRQLGDGSAARRALVRARAIAGEDRQEGWKTAAFATLNLGWVDEQDGDWKRAAERYRRALDAFVARGERIGAAAASFGLAKAARAAGDPAAAERWQRDALALIEARRDVDRDPVLGATFFGTKRHYAEQLIDLQMARHRAAPTAGHAARALATAERSRARALLDSLTASGVELAGGVAPSLRARADALEEALAAAAEERLRTGRGLDDRVVRAQHAELRALQAAFGASHAGYAALAWSQPATLDAARALLGDDSVLLSFIVGANESYLWLLDRDRLDAVRLPARKELAGLARAVHQTAAAGGHPLVRKRGRQALERLGEVLLGPIAERLDRQRLVIVADGALHYVPFAALTVPGRGRALVADHEIVHLPSMAVLDVLRRRAADRPTPAGTLAVIGAPVRPILGAPLPHAGDEAAALLALVPAERRLALLGTEATHAAVTGGRLAGYRLLHFVTHGHVETAVPELSGLALEPVDRDGTPVDGVLWAHQLYGLHLPADLVVLSACDTALGRAIRGEGLLGLTHGFLHAGATRVVVTLWQVDDAATAALMVRFYRALLEEGRTPAAALRTAQLALRADPDFATSIDWAAFALHGDWR